MIEGYNKASRTATSCLLLQQLLLPSHRPEKHRQCQGQAFKKPAIKTVSGVPERETATSKTRPRVTSATQKGSKILPVLLASAPELFAFIAGQGREGSYYHSHSPDILSLSSLEVCTAPRHTAFKELTDVSEFIAVSVTKGGIFPSEGKETEVLCFLSARTNSGQSEIGLRL